MKQEIKELLIQLNSEFSASNLTELFVTSGVLNNAVMPEREEFGRFIFLQSNSEEIYSTLERRFIANVSHIYLYPEYTKITARGRMKCRIVCVDLSQAEDGIYEAILFMKLINKALEGWIFFLIKLPDGIHLGMRVFDKDETLNCALCDLNDTEIILGDMLWSGEIADFISYYEFFYEAIYPKDKNLLDYDEAATRRRGIQHQYLEIIRDIEKNYSLSMATEIARYINWFEKPEEYSFYMEFLDAMEELKSVRSFKVNTLEMLFEADELEKITKENEQVYQQSISSMPEEREVDKELFQQYGDDPEAMIKYLKEKKGIL